VDQSGVDHDPDPQLAWRRSDGVVIGQEKAEGRDNPSQQCFEHAVGRVDESQEAVAPVAEPVPVAGLDTRRTQRRVEQVVYGRAEFGLDRVGAAGGILDVERDDGPLAGYRRTRPCPAI
jgi:hypothetical protein